MRMRRLAIPLTLLVGLVLLPQIPASAKSCSAYLAPDYNAGRMAVNFLVDIQDCWESDRAFVMTGSIVRGSGLEESRESKKATCFPIEPCRLQLIMEHPEIELTNYSLQIKFRPVPRGDEKVEQRYELTCFSGPYYTTRCFD